MKLSEILYTLQKVLPKINVLNFETYNSGSNSHARILNVNTFRLGLDELRNIDIFDEQIYFFDNSPLMLKAADTIVVTPVEARTVKEKFNNLKTSIELLNRALDLAIPNDDKDENTSNSIFVKLPETESLDELAKNISAFHKILSNSILHPKINGQVVLENVEPGSIWMKIYVGSFLAVNVVGGLAWAATVINKKYQESRIIEELVNQQELDNEHKKNLIDAHKQITNILIANEAKHLYNEFYHEKDIDHDQVERLKLSLELLSNQIHKGAQINPALMAPEEVSNLFPDSNHMSLIESKIKKLDK